MYTLGMEKSAERVETHLFCIVLHGNNVAVGQ